MHYNPARCVKVCCSVLQCVAVCCNVLQVAHNFAFQTCKVCCSVLQCVAVCCSVLQCYRWSITFSLQSSEVC